MKDVEEAVALTDKGLEGDRHCRKPPGGKRQVLLLDEDSLHLLRLPIGALKENLVIAGLSLESMKPGARLRIGKDVVVALTGPCTPCQKLDQLRPGLMSEAWGHRGQ